MDELSDQMQAVDLDVYNEIDMSFDMSFDDSDGDLDGDSDSDADGAGDSDCDTGDKEDELEPDDL